jgi:hypothetical protein
MAFNEQGEIIRSSGEAGGNHPGQQDNQYNLGCGFMWAIILFYFLYDLMQSFTHAHTDSIITNVATDTSGYQSEIIPGNGKVAFYTKELNNMDIEVKVDGRYLGMLSFSGDSAYGGWDSYATISTSLRAGEHWVEATDTYGRNCSFNFFVFDGQCLPLELKLETPKLSLIDPGTLQALSGDWYGKGYYTGSNETWDVLVSFNDTTKQFYVSYPLQGCVGILVIEEIRTGNIYFDEHILYGSPRCISAKVKLEIDDLKRLYLKYYDQSEGKLIREVTLQKLENAVTVQ